MRRYRVRLTPEAEEDLLRLYDFLLERDLDAAETALQAIEEAFRLLSFSPFSCRKALLNDSPLVRELVVPFGSAGYVALFEVEPPEGVVVLAVRHQREEDYR